MKKLNETEINFLCDAIRSDFDSSKLSKRTLVERLETAMSIFAKLEINTHERVVNLVREMKSDLDQVPLF